MKIFEKNQLHLSRRQMTAAMIETWVEMKTERVEKGWFYAAQVVLNTLKKVIICRGYLDI
jgi:hypothetical protein